MSVLYRPKDGVAADFIPFFWKGDYHLFYLKDYRDEAGHGQGTPWWHLVTRDFVHFEDWGEALPRGAVDAPDLWVFTGSVIEREGLFHIFYTGHNSHLKEAGKPVECIMHATSPDLRVWKKEKGFLFGAPAEEGYEPDDWRDPFVFANPEAGEYWMLLAARRHSGPKRNRGCVALAASRDLRRWEVRPPFWSPDLYHTHECPDLFRMGEWWYLLYSTFSERCVTHYRMSRSLRGPWLCPADDAFDGRAFYAAKSAGDDERRYLFGWLATRAGDEDAGAWQWGGSLVVHELIQQPDGTLSARMPATMCSVFDRAVELSPKPRLGTCVVDVGTFRVSAIGRHSALTLAVMPRTCLAEATVVYKSGTASCGLLLRADASLESYYQVRLEPARQRLVVDHWPRPGDQPFLLERPLALAPDRAVTLRALVDGSNLVIYAGDRVALSCRMYDHRDGAVGLFVTEGEARFEGLGVRVAG